MFGFLKEKLKQTVERFTKKVDESTEIVEPSEKVKKELLKEKKEEKKKKESKLKKEESKVKPEPKSVKKEKRKEVKEEPKKEEKKGFFAKLKEKFIHTEEKEAEKESIEIEEEKKQEVKEEIFKTSEEERKELEEAFKEAEHAAVEAEKEEELIPVVLQTETGETVFEMQEKPTAVRKQKKEEEKKEEIKKEVKEEKKESIEEKGFFGALKDTIFKTALSEEKFEEIFWELEVILLENNVAVEVIELIKKNLKKKLVETKILRGEIQNIITETLRESIEQTLDVESIDIFEQVKEKKPYVIVFVGINGSGKTTTIAKIAQLLKNNKLSCVMAAGDTFRAAAIQQLEEHANNLHVKLIKHDYGSDPAAVGFDAIKYAKAHNIDCVLIDTAGRLHSNTNLVDEMKKIIRVTKPDLKLFIGEAITGNDCVEQARKFNEAIGIDGIILAKADVDEKGGAALSVSYVTGKPILYLGTGQGYNDLEAFDSEKIIEQLGLG